MALTLGLAVTGVQLRKMIDRKRHVEDQLRTASGAFGQLVIERFAEWGLTPSERDVALLSLKGFTIVPMPRLRDSREGTIKSQCNAVYRKAGVSGRPQLLGAFIEELLNVDLLAEGRQAS